MTFTAQTNSKQPVLRELIWEDLSDVKRDQLCSRGLEAIFDEKLTNSIGLLIDDVRANGDDALVRALKTYDRVELSPKQLRASDEDFQRAHDQISPQLVEAIDDMISHIRRFNEEVLTRKGQSWSFELSPGHLLGEKVSPIQSAALFCPSGKASYPSVLAQIGTPCMVAGVEQVIVLTPPKPNSSEIDAATLVVANKLGIDSVFRLNGPSSIAAGAFGTQSVPKCLKIVGPGSPAVTIAQLMVQQYGTTSMTLLGPSESLILADDSADPQLLAADLLNEAEHGTDSTTLLVTNSVALIAATQVELSIQIALLPPERREAASSALGVNGGSILVSSIEVGAQVANRFGPEHMQIATSNPTQTMELIHCAGEILLGQNTPISSANNVLGCPASLPTSGFASVSRRVTVETFLKRSAVAQLTNSAMLAQARSVISLATHEGFPAHANALKIRVARSESAK